VAPGAPGNVALFNGGNGLFGDGSNNRHDWFATVRGRLGYAIDRLLIYGTGGVAFRDTNNDNGFLGGFASGAAERSGRKTTSSITIPVSGATAFIRGSSTSRA